MCMTNWRLHNSFRACFLRNKAGPNWDRFSATRNDVFTRTVVFHADRKDRPTLASHLTQVFHDRHHARRFVVNRRFPASFVPGQRTIWPPLLPLLLESLALRVKQNKPGVEGVFLPLLSYLDIRIAPLLELVPHLSQPTRRQGNSWYRNDGRYRRRHGLHRETPSIDSRNMRS